MKYRDGAEVRAGDIVTLGAWRGTVVFSLDSQDFAEGFVPENWAFLECGIMIDVDGVGLVHETSSEDLEFVSAGRE